MTAVPQQRATLFESLSAFQAEAEVVRRQITLVIGDVRDEPGINNVMILPPYDGDYRDPASVFRIVVMRNGVARHVSDAPRAQVERLFMLVAGLAGRPLNGGNPSIDAVLPGGGERIHIDVPPASRAPQCTIRLPYTGRITLEEMVRQGILDPRANIHIQQIVARGGASILISGAVGAGKTTLLRAFQEMIAIQRGVPLYIQDPVEFEPSAPNAISLEADRNSTNRTIRHHVIAALRWEHSHLILGEGRGEEMLHITEAAATGTPVFTTIHAESPHDALDRVADMVGMAGVEVNDRVMRRIARAFRYVIHVTRDGDRRYCSPVHEVKGFLGGGFTISAI